MSVNRAVYYTFFKQLVIHYFRYGVSVFYTYSSLCHYIPHFFDLPKCYVLCQTKEAIDNKTVIFIY